MSWLKNHFRHFVVPGIWTIVQDRGRRAGQLTDADIKQVDRKLRPSSKCKYPEAGMLYTLAASILTREDVTREIVLDLCRRIGNDDSIVYDLDLGKNYDKGRVRELGEGYKGVEGYDVLHSFIGNSIKALKRRTRRQATVIYPGRDVWCWEVLSRRLGMPSLYDSRVSRCVAGNQTVLKKVMKDWSVPNWERTVLFDSGYAGTVPRAIGQAAGLEKANVLMLSAIKSEEQVFPTHTKARKKALACEYLAKYHKRTEIQNDEAVQYLADLEEFFKSALLTIWLWHHVSPARLPSWQDEPAAPTFKKSKGSGNLQVVSNNGVVWDPNAPPIPTIHLNSSPWGLGSITGTGSTSVLTASSTSSNISFNSIASTNTTGFMSSANTLDSLWGAGTSHQVLLDIIDDQNQQIAALQNRPGPIQPPVKFPSVHQAPASIPPARQQSALNVLTGSPPGVVPQIDLRIERDKKGGFVKKTTFTTPLVSPSQNGSGSGTSTQPPTMPSTTSGGSSSASSATTI